MRCLAHRGVLYRGDQQPRSRWRSGLHRAAQCKIVRLGSASGEHHARSGAADESGDVLPSQLDSPRLPLPEPMHRGRVADPRRQCGEHLLGHTRVQWCRGVVVEVDLPHGLKLYGSGTTWSLICNSPAGA